MSDRRLPYVLGISLGLGLGLAVVLVLTLTPGTRLYRGSEETTTPLTTTSDLSPVPIEVDRGNAIVAATQAVSPSVVSINAFRGSRNRFLSPQDMIRLMLGGRTMSEDPGLGSGFIVDHRGYILTNNHVVNDADEIVVTLQDGEHYRAQVVGASTNYDLALIKINGQIRGLPAVTFGDSEGLSIGEWAIAIGSPFGYLLEDTSPTVTVGVISATHRDLKGDDRGRINNAFYYDMIQTDAAINPGNSGGPLVNAAGEVVGINTFLISDTGAGGSVGVGFAAPATRCQWFIREILEYDRLRVPYIGMEGEFLTAYHRRYVYPNTPRGLLVQAVAQGSPADEAGLRPDDVIVAIDGQETVDPRSFSRGVYEARVGASLTLDVWRDGQVYVAEVTVIEHPYSQP